MSIDNIRGSQSNVAFSPDEEKKPTKKEGAGFGSSLIGSQKNVDSDKPKPFTLTSSAGAASASDTEETTPYTSDIEVYKPENKGKVELDETKSDPSVKESLINGLREGYPADRLPDNLEGLSEDELATLTVNLWKEDIVTGNPQLKAAGIDIGVPDNLDNCSIGEIASYRFAIIILLPLVQK